MLAVCSAKRCRNLPPHPPHGPEAAEVATRMPSVSSANALAAPFQLRVKVVGPSRSTDLKAKELNLNVIESNTVNEVKERIADALGIAVRSFWSLHPYLGDNIEGGHLADHGIVSDMELFLVVDQKASEGEGAPDETDPKCAEAAKGATNATRRIAHTLVDFNNDQHLRKLVHEGLQHDSTWQRAYLVYCCMHEVESTSPEDLDIELLKEFVERNFAEFAEKSWAQSVIREAILNKTTLPKTSGNTSVTSAEGDAEQISRAGQWSRPAKATTHKPTSAPGVQHPIPSATAVSAGISQVAQYANEKRISQKRKLEGDKVPKPSSAPAVSPSWPAAVPSSAPQFSTRSDHGNASVIRRLMTSHGAGIRPSSALARREVQSKQYELYEWLKGLDGGTGVLLEYFDVLVEEFDGNLSQIAAAKASGNGKQSVVDRVDPLFWETVRVTRIGHKIMFARGIAQL
eukprot:TRINITY_DN50804_c0_g1_i1.p1 TRINITY_DN50804_c0_g1~~TRINITY_DN50804_c0_g1_i1.p1  ORF type:complete len:458 (+),score=62.64 TRINITY_DN50804_c0_g1_i1:89-1462(+)